MESFDKWASTYKKYNKEQTGCFWPSETLVRMMKGNYISDLDKNFDGKNVLDIGFGNGNNLTFLNSIGLQVYGTEVHKNICDMVQKRLDRLQIESQLKVGTNRAIPFRDQIFDYLISWNVLHYEKSHKDIHEALFEYKRVLKPGGRFFLSTTGPKHKILQGARRLGNHVYQIGRSDDFRKGETYFYFEEEAAIKKCFTPYFDKLKIGRLQEHLFDDILDFFIITGVKER